MIVINSLGKPVEKLAIEISELLENTSATIQDLAEKLGYKGQYRHFVLENARDGWLSFEKTFEILINLRQLLGTPEAPIMAAAA